VIETVEQIINAALQELFDSNVIDRSPDESDDMRTFTASCFIETGPGGSPIMVTFRDWLVFVELRNDEYVAYFSMEREKAALTNSS
jgi:hypothetical protein